MTKKQRLFAFLLAGLLAVVVLFSAFFISQNSNHHCAQENCPVCQQLELCECALQTLAVAVVAVCFSFLLFLHKEQKCLSEGRRFGSPSLVSLKVKLSN